MIEMLNLILSILAALGVPIFCFICILFAAVSLKLLNPKAKDKSFSFRKAKIPCKDLLLSLLLVLFLALLIFSMMDAAGFASSRSQAVRVLAAISTGFLLGFPAGLLILFYGKVANRAI